MPGLSFMPQFSTAVENGLALQAARRLPNVMVLPKFNTIRPRRVRPIKVGDKLYLWERMRSPARRKLGEAVCIDVRPITLCADRDIVCEGFHAIYGNHPWAGVRFARSEGFESLAELFEFFEKAHGLPFSGDLIRWGEPF